MNSKEEEKEVVKRGNFEQAKQKDSETLFKKLKKKSPLVTRNTLERKRAKLESDVVKSQEAKEAGEDLARQARKREQKSKDRITELERLLKEKTEQSEKGAKISGDKKEIEKLQREIEEDIDYIILLQKELNVVEGKWQKKIFDINNELLNVQKQLKNTTDNLEINQLEKNKLNSEIIRLKSDISIVNKKLKGVAAERDNNSSILLHQREKIITLEQEKDNLVQDHKELSTLYQETERQIEELNNEIINFKKTREQEVESSKKVNIKSQEVLNNLKRELQNSQDEVGQIKQKLEAQSKDFITQILLLENLSKEEREKLTEQIEILKNEKLGEGEQFSRKIKVLEDKINSLKIADKKKNKSLEVALNEFKEKLQEKLGAEVNYQTKIQELEKQLVDTVKSKEQKLGNLHNNLVLLKSQLSEANGVIQQQTKKIDQKNQKIEKLLNELKIKSKLIEKLTSEMDDEDKKASKQERTIIEREQLIEETTSKPSVVSDNMKIETTTNGAFSDEKLLLIIEGQKQEIQRLKSLIVEKSSNIVQEMPLQETIQQLPKKNNAVLYLSLLAAGLAITALCFDLLRKKQKRV